MRLTEPRVAPLSESEWSFTVDQHNRGSMALNTAGVRLDVGIEGFSR